MSCSSRQGASGARSRPDFDVRQTVELQVALSKGEAWMLAQFLKRVGFSDYMNNAMDKEEAYAMLYAGEKVRKALAEVGFAPR